MRTEVARKYNHFQSFVVGRYVIAIFPAWTVLSQIINVFSVALQTSQVVRNNLDTSFDVYPAC